MRANRTPRLIVATALSLSLVAAACGGDDDDATDATDAPEDTAAPAASATVAPTATEPTGTPPVAATTPPVSATDGACGDGSLEQLVAAAQAEGQVNLIALPPTWANYEGILASWDELYGIAAPVANPDASSADELTAIETLRGQPDMPEAYDVGPSFTQELIDKGYAEVYMPTTWGEIPDVLKDPDGHWVGAYYGILQMFVNTTLAAGAPTSFADLKDPVYAGQVAINGDPREAGAAFATVMAASIANGGSFDDIMPGIEYFAELKQLGVFQTFDVSENNVLQGEIPITLDWSYNWPGREQALTDAGFEYTLSVPTDAKYAGFYAQGVVTEAAHPCAARLWIEHITGDEGALGYLEGGAIPARIAAMLEAGVVPEELAATLPPADELAAIEFPTQEQVDAAKQVLTENWGPMVADA